MKTITFKSILTYFSFFIFSFSVVAQEYPATIIDVRSSRGGDSMWLFTVEGTTDYFDNGWDGKKLFGSSLGPSIFAIGPDYYYQVYTSSSIHNTEIGFRPGVDTLFTLKFIHYYTERAYENLYLIDKKTNTTTNIFPDVVVYSFTGFPEDALNRFTIVSYVQEEVVVDDPDDKNKDEKLIPRGRGNNNGKSNKIKAFNYDNLLIIDNQINAKGIATIVDIRSGRVVSNYVVDPSSVSTLETNLSKGSYIVNIVVEDETASLMIIL